MVDPLFILTQKFLLYNINFGWNTTISLRETSSIYGVPTQKHDYSWTSTVCHYYIANASHKSLIFNNNPLQRSILNSIYRKCSENSHYFGIHFANFHFKLRFIVCDGLYVRYVRTNSYLNFHGYAFICRVVVLSDFSIVRWLGAGRITRALNFLMDHFCLKLRVEAHFSSIACKLDLLRQSWLKFGR